MGTRFDVPLGLRRDADADVEEYFCARGEVKMWAVGEGKVL